MIHDTVMLMLIILFFCLVVLIIAMKSIQMPSDYFKRQKERKELRKKLIKMKIPTDETPV
jgi:hypothetical protein